MFKNQEGGVDGLVGGVSAATNCTGNFTNGTCSKTCGGGTLTQTYQISATATNGGFPCPFGAGETKSVPCNVQTCRMCYVSLSLFLSLSLSLKGCNDATMIHRVYQWPNLVLRSHGKACFLQHLVFAQSSDNTPV